MKLIDRDEVHGKPERHDEARVVMTLPQEADPPERCARHVTI
jgi:hypothetical protein